MGSRKYFIITLAIILVISSQIVGAYELTARSFGMGGAFSAIAEDVETVLYNPAGIADSGTIGVNGSTGFVVNNIEGLKKLKDIDGDLDYNDIPELMDLISDDLGLKSQVFLGARLTSIGLAYNLKDELYLDYKSEYNADFSRDKISEGIVNYGGNIIDPAFNIGTISYGANLKLINVNREVYKLDGMEETGIDAEGNGIGIDLGILAKVTDNLKLAGVVENAFVSDIKLEGTEKRYALNETGWDYTGEEPYSAQMNFKRKVRVGASAHVPLVGITVAADIDDFFAPDGGQVYHLGVEKGLFFNALSLRAGKMTGEEVDYTTVGLGVNLTGFSADLGFGRDSHTGNLTGLLSASMNF